MDDLNVTTTVFPSTVSEVFFQEGTIVVLIRFSNFAFISSIYVYIFANEYP
jgi:hypothetical protein